MARPERTSSWRVGGVFVLGIFSSVVSIGAAPGGESGKGRTMDITVRVDRGEDTGQSFGSLFEGRTPDGKLVVGAGFLDVYNTRFRSDRHTVHFFVRPTAGDREIASTPLPRPGELAGTYMFDRDGVLYANNPTLRAWNEAESRWDDAPKAFVGMRVGAGMLRYHGGEVSYNGKPILTKPDQGGYDRFYYACGHLFFYHRHSAGKGGYREYVADDQGYSKLHACPWRPGDGAVDLSRAVVLTLPVVGETTFAFGQLGGHVLTCSNIGGLYRFDGKAWKMLRKPTIGRSYQIYSMLNYYDRLLMGQYPTGRLFEFDGEQVRELAGWPPRIEGVSANAREAQTTVIYGGDLFVGVWPWGELWRYNRDTNKWTFAKRLFREPSLTDKTTHPYENECIKLKVVANQWGQRVTGLLPLGADLMVSTSAKWPCEWAPKFDFLADDKWKEYGTVHRLTMPGHLAAPVAWTDGPTELRFVIDAGRVTILQDGKKLASAPLPDSLTPGDGLEKVTWRHGVFGAFGGKALDGSVR